VSTDSTMGADNGHGGQPGTLLPAGRPDRFAGNIRPAGTPLGGLTARQGRPEPEPPGSWPRFLLKHACWVLLITIAAVAGAHLLLHAQTRIYKSQASVLVQPPANQVGTLQAPDMATEKGIVSSNVVLTIAGRALHLPTGQLFNGLSATSPGNTYLLTISYSGPNPYIAQQRGEAIAEAYVTYRTPKPVPQTAKGKKPTSAVVTPTATLITPASLPASPSSPKPALDYGIAVLVGLGLGIGTAAIRDRLSDRLRGPADLEARAAAPLLALIPAFWSIGHRRASRLVMLSRPESAVADAYRDLRTRIVQAADAAGASTLVVTCPAREDKDAVAANLAVTLAQSGGSTVLVCADLRWGQAHRLFGLVNGQGLTGLLDRRTYLDNALTAVGVPGLQVLPAGPPPRDTGAMLQRPAFRSILSALQDRADFVVIDAPPVLASADAGLLADAAEMVLLVADVRRSARAQVSTAMREASVQDHIIGCVLTGAGRRRLLWRSRLPVLTRDARRQTPSVTADNT
jgi:tyrosine-protein kinase